MDARQPPQRDSLSSVTVTTDGGVFRLSIAAEEEVEATRVQRPSQQTEASLSITGGRAGLV